MLYDWYAKILPKEVFIKTRFVLMYLFWLFGTNFAVNLRIDSVYLSLENANMINFTESARKKVAEMTAESSPGKLLRIFVEPGGCSGFEYGMSIDEPKPTDRVGDFSGVGYAVDADSLDYLTGCEIHFDDGLSGKGFEIRNPNAESTCGCGKSFN